MKKDLSREEINKRIGINIRFIRKSHKLSQEKFAEKIDLSPQFISDVERGVEGISLSTVIKICNTMKCSPLVIFANLIDYEKDNQDNITKLVGLSDKNKEILDTIVESLLNTQ